MKGQGRAPQDIAVNSTDALIAPPLTAQETADLREQIENCWNTAAFSGDPLAVKEKLQIRVRLSSDGKVLATEVLNDQSDNPHFRLLRESAIRAIIAASPLKLPVGKRFDSVLLNFDPSEFQ